MREGVRFIAFFGLFGLNLSRYNFLYSCKLFGTFQNASAAVNVTVLNVNDWDPRFRFPQYEFFVPDLGDLGEAGNELVAVGMVEAADGDRGDKITLSLQGPAAK